MRESCFEKLGGGRFPEEAGIWRGTKGERNWEAVGEQPEEQEGNQKKSIVTKEENVSKKKHMTVNVKGYQMVEIKKTGSTESVGLTEVSHLVQWWQECWQTGVEAGGNDLPVSSLASNC